MKRDLSRYYPPGCDREKWNGMAVLGLIAMGFVQVVIYFYRFSMAYDMLNWDVKHTVIISGNVKMAPFSMLTKSCIIPLLLFIAYCILWAVLLRASFSQYSSSIYIMKRLPSSRELWIRCVSAPAMFAVIAIAVSAVLILFFRLHYGAKVPGMCIPEDMAEYMRSIGGYTPW